MDSWATVDPVSELAQDHPEWASDPLAARAAALKGLALAEPVEPEVPEVQEEPEWARSEQVREMVVAGWEVWAPEGLGASVATVAPGYFD